MNKQLLRATLIASFCWCMTGAFVGCDRDDAKKVGDKVENGGRQGRLTPSNRGLDKAGDAANRGINSANDAARRAADQAKDAASTARDAVGRAAQKSGEAVERGRAEGEGLGLPHDRSHGTVPATVPSTDKE